MSKFEARQVGSRVAYNMDPPSGEMPWEKAIEVAKALYAMAKRAETFSKSDIIAADSAILLRSGAPFSLAPNKKIWDEAKKLAEWDRNLRKIPTSIESAEFVPPPSIISHPPKGQHNGQ